MSTALPLALETRGLTMQFGGLRAVVKLPG